MDRKKDVNFNAPSWFPKRVNVVRSGSIYSFPFKKEQEPHKSDAQADDNKAKGPAKIYIFDTKRVSGY